MERFDLKKAKGNATEIEIAVPTTRGNVERIDSFWDLVPTPTLWPLKLDNWLAPEGMLAQAAKLLDKDPRNNPVDDSRTVIYFNDDNSTPQAGKWVVENLCLADVEAFLATFLGKVKLGESYMVYPRTSDMRVIIIK